MDPSSLRKQPTSRDATGDFPAKCRLRNERRGSILRTYHYSELVSASDRMQQISNQSVISIEFLQSFFRSHFKGETTGDVAKCRMFSKATIVDKILGTLAFLERFPIYTCPTPPLTPQTTFYASIHNFQVSTLFSKKELQENSVKDVVLL